MSFLSRTAAFMGIPLATKSDGGAQAFLRNAGGSTKENRNLSNVIFPTSFVRPKVDLSTWADAIKEAEQAGWPYRVLMQYMYEKTKLNGHVAACIQRRKELTLLRDYEIRVDGKRDEQWTKYFKLAWFKQTALDLMLDAQYFGYTLASIGGIKNGVPVDIINVKRWNISPDRQLVSMFERMPGGYSWNDPRYEPWHVWMPTPQTNGINNCGYGLLYVISAMAIQLQNNEAYNADFIEMFAQPYRHLKTNDLEGEEFEAKKKMLEQMGSSGYGITGLSDELEFLNDGARGNGYKAYNDFDHRKKGDISKFIGGHADFIDSATKSPGQGSQNSGAGDVTDDATGNSQVQKATAAKRMIDGDWCTTLTNEMWIPKLQGLGIAVPSGAEIVFLNDTEERAVSAQIADKNQKWGTLGLTLAQAGYQIEQGELEGLLDLKLVKVDIMPDKNVLTDKKEQAAGAGPLKDDRKKRTDKPKHTK